MTVIIGRLIGRAPWRWAVVAALVLQPLLGALPGWPSPPALPFDAPSARAANDAARSWGSNAAGQLGDTTTANRGTPVAVSALPAVTALSAGGSHSLALTGDGRVWAWGDNGYGQLGDGSTADRHTPIQLSGLTTVTAIAAGGTHSLALLGDGTVWAWGATRPANWATAAPASAPRRWR